MKPRLGPSIYFKEFDPTLHADKLFEWYYDVNYAAFFREFGSLVLSKKEMRHFGKAMEDSGLGLFVITARKDNQPAGLMTYRLLDPSQMLFRFGIMLDQKSQHFTSAIEAIINLCFYLVDVKGAKKIIVQFLETDKHIRRISEKGGLELEARLEATGELLYCFPIRTIEERYRKWHETFDNDKSK